jgi:hypothetical protein
LPVCHPLGISARIKQLPPVGNPVSGAIINAAL